MLNTDNPVLLYLANKNTSGDPVTGQAGGMYYNSAMASFRCFYSGFWRNCADKDPQHSFSVYDESWAARHRLPAPSAAWGGTPLQ
jgi:hypothetical protein